MGVLCVCFCNIALPLLLMHAIGHPVSLFLSPCLILSASMNLSPRGMINIFQWVVHGDMEKEGVFFGSLLENLRVSIQVKEKKNHEKNAQCL